MRLREQLEARFIRITTGHSFQYVDTLEDAQGILFLCPKCFASNGGPVGTHSVICWFKHRGVPDDLEPGPGRWEPSGLGYHDVSLTPSVNLSDPGGCLWHGWVKEGGAE